MMIDGVKYIDMVRGEAQDLKIGYLEGEKSWELQPSYQHELDEVSGKILTPEKRVDLQRWLASQLLKEGNFGFGKEIFLRELPWLGPDRHVAVAMGVNESRVSGLKATQHEFLWRPKDKDAFVAMDKEGREKELRNKVAKAKHVIIDIHGWDGAQQMYDGYEAELLRPMNEDESNRAMLEIGKMHGSDLIGEGDELREEIENLPEDTVVVSISIMGALGGLDKENAADLTKEGVVTQVYEAMDEIGKFIAECKMEEVVSPEWRAEKMSLIAEIQNAMVLGNLDRNVGDVNFLNGSWHEKMQKLYEILHIENLLANGRYGDEMVDQGKGHSMGGNIFTSIYSQIVLGKILHAETIKWKSEARPEKVAWVSDQRARIEAINANVFDENSGVNFESLEDAVMYQALAVRRGVITLHQAFLDRLRKEIEINSKIVPADQLPLNSMDGEYQNMTFQSWMQVVFGNNATDLPEWAENIKSMADMKREGLPILLQKDPLLGSIMLTAKYSEKIAKSELKIGDFVNLVIPLLEKYVGKDLPEKLYEMYKAGLMDDMTYVLACDRILKDMSTPMDDATMASIKVEHLAKIAIFGGGKDYTVNTDLLVGMGKRMESNAQSHNGNGSAKRSIVRIFEKSGHHPKTPDLAEIKIDSIGKSLYSSALRRSRYSVAAQEIAFWLNENMLSKRSLATSTLIG